MSSADVKRYKKVAGYIKKGKEEAKEGLEIGGIKRFAV